jgi:hypothetical protein
MFRKTALSVAFVLSSAFAGAQTKVASQNVTIPARKITQKVTLNGRSAQITFTIPAQTVSVPTPAVPAAPPALPDGLTYANGVLTVTGSIKATSIDLTGGTALPTSASGLYLLQMTGGFLQPVPYVPYTPPPSGALMITPGAPDCMSTGCVKALVANLPTQVAQ